MRLAGFPPSRVKPSCWAHATRLTYAPRQGLLRPCALQTTNSGQRRFLQETTPPLGVGHSAQNDQVLEKDPMGSSTNEASQPIEIDPESKPNSTKPVKDENWIWKHTGARIQLINVNSLKGTEEYVSHSSGTKLLCSWTFAPGSERAIWVPGDAPRVRDLQLPVDLKPEAALTPPTSNWTLGSPQLSFEPFFASLASMNPLANFDSTDIIVRSGTLCLLLGVVRGNLKPFGVVKAIAFRLALVNDTLLIQRIPYSDQETHGFGRGLTATLTNSFTNKITEMKASDDDMPSGPSHHSHAVRYDLAHLNCVVITPVDAATGNASLPPVSVPDNKTLGLPQSPESVKVNLSGRGVPPAAVTRLMTGMIRPEVSERRLNYKGKLKIKPAVQAKFWFDRPKTILQGHLEPPPPGAPEDSARLSRVIVREAEPILNQMEDACQLELRKLVALLERLRHTAKRAGGSCILACLPRQLDEDGRVKVPAKFAVYECGPGAEPLILDWHAERFWSKK